MLSSPYLLTLRCSDGFHPWLFLSSTSALAFTFKSVHKSPIQPCASHPDLWPPQLWCTSAEVPWTLLPQGTALSLSGVLNSKIALSESPYSSSSLLLSLHPVPKLVLQTFLQILIWQILTESFLLASGNLVISKKGRAPYLHRTCSPAEERGIN